MARRSFDEREKLKKDIVIFCKKNYKTSREISEFFDINYNTIRSKYIYPLIKEGKLLIIDDTKEKKIARNFRKYKAA
jgi:uncharacterized protein YlbG (UPF0298 family)